MAITGLVIMPMGDTKGLREKIEALGGLTYYGAAQGDSMVYVLESPSSELEDRLKAIGDVEGVAAVLPTSVNIEDELEAGGESGPNRD